MDINDIDSFVDQIGTVAIAVQEALEIFTNDVDIVETGGGLRVIENEEEVAENALTQLRDAKEKLIAVIEEIESKIA